MPPFVNANNVVNLLECILPTNKNIDYVMNNNTVSNINPFIVTTSCFESPFL